MTGFILRRAIAMKDAGERLGWGWLIRAGLRLKEAARHGKIK